MLYFGTGGIGGNMRRSIALLPGVLAPALALFMVSCWDASPTASHDVPVISSPLKDTTISIFDTVVFTVTASDPQGIKEYLWDFNGDGVIDKTTPSKSAS